MIPGPSTCKWSADAPTAFHRSAPGRTDAEVFSNHAARGTPCLRQSSQGRVQIRSGEPPRERLGDGLIVGLAPAYRSSTAARDLQAFGARTFRWTMEKAISIWVSQLTRIRRGAIVHWLRWGDPLSTTQTTRRAER